jgi:hypothetical protein
LAKGVTFSHDELALLHETLSYALKRTFSEAEKIRLKDLLSRVEDRLLGQTAVERPFGMTEPEMDALLAAAETYCEALQQPLSAEISRTKAARVKELLARFQRRTGVLEWFRQRFGRRP